MRTPSLDRNVGAFFLPASAHQTLAAAGQYVAPPGSQVMRTHGTGATEKIFVILFDNK